MVHLSLGVDVLARADHHVLGRRDVDEWRLARVVVRHPERDGVAVGGTTEDGRYCAGKVEEEGGRAIGEGCEVRRRTGLWILAFINIL